MDGFRKIIFKNRKHPRGYLYCIANYHNGPKYQNSMEYFDIKGAERLMLRMKNEL